MDGSTLVNWSSNILAVTEITIATMHSNKLGLKHSSLLILHCLVAVAAVVAFVAKEKKFPKESRRIH